MSVQSTNSIAGGVSSPASFVAGQSTLPRQKPSFELPKSEVETKIVSPELLQTAVDEANKVLRETRPDIQFVIDSDSNEVVIKLIEPSSGQVINQYPTEQAMAISNAITQFQQQSADRRAAYQSSSALLGLFVKQKS